IPLADTSMRQRHRSQRCGDYAQAERACAAREQHAFVDSNIGTAHSSGYVNRRAQRKHANAFRVWPYGEIEPLVAEVDVAADVETSDIGIDDELACGKVAI